MGFFIYPANCLEYAVKQTPYFDHRKPKRAQVPFLYYPNSCATHQLLLLGGDVALNLGPCHQLKIKKKTLSSVSYLMQGT